MLKRTQLLELRNNIKNTRVSFISIVMFVALGIAIFSSFAWVALSLTQIVDDEFNEASLCDFSITCPYGITEEGIDAIEKLDDFDEVETVRTAFSFFKTAKGNCQIRIGELGNKINKPIMVEGRLPEKKGEIAVEAWFADNHGLKIGDDITFENSDGCELTTYKFKITALMESAAYISKASDTYGTGLNNLAVDGLMFTSKDSFSNEFDTCYQELLIKSNKLRGLNTFSDEYKKQSKSIEEKNTKELKKLRKSIKKSIAGVNGLEGSICTREYNFGFSAIRIVIQSIKKMKMTMAMLFFIVGLLVCYSAVSRNVYNHTILIGTKKSLGFYNIETTLGYLLYTASAVVLGAILGFLIAIFLIEQIMINILSEAYVISETLKYYEFSLILILTLVELLLMLLCTWFACYDIHKKNPVELLTGSFAIKKGKLFFEKLSIFKRLSPFNKVVVRNFFIDRKRVISTILGIVGCTALVVCAITMSDNTDMSFGKQFDKFYSFNKIVYYQNVENKKTEKNIKNRLKNKGIKFACAHCGAGLVSMPDKTQMGAQFYVPTDDNFEDFVKIHPTQKLAVPDDEAVWVNISYAEEFGAKPGDKIELENSFGEKKKFKIAGFYEYYLVGMQIIFSKEVYEKGWQEKPVSNAMFICSKESAKQIEDVLSDIEGYAMTNDYYVVAKNYFEAFTSVSKALEVVYLVLAILLAFLVLLNLFTLFVEEKRKELIILLINGYSIKKARAYIYRDTMLLTVIGIILGVVLGTFIAKISIRAAQNSVTYFISDVNPFACVMGVVICAVLSFLMLKVAFMRVKKFELPDINR